MIGVQSISKDTPVCSDCQPIYLGRCIGLSLPSRGSAARLADLDLHANIPFMPDRAVTVKSSSKYAVSARRLHERALYYLENESQLVWLIDPESEAAEVCTRAADGTIRIAPLGQDGVLEGGDVLLGFALPLRDVFR